MTDAVTRTVHELVSFAVFLDYRAKRMRAPVVGGPATTPTPADPAPPDGEVVEAVVPITRDE
jgi:hypothetical protein